MSDTDNGDLPIDRPQTERPRRGRPPAQAAEAAPPPADLPEGAKMGPDGKIQFPPRRRQQPLDGMMQKRLPVNVPMDDRNYAYRIVNDDPGRVNQFKKNDWDIVPDNGEYQVSKGELRRAYLMRKPLPYYEEDQAAKSRHANAPLEALKAGKGSGDQRARGPQTSDGREGTVESRNIRASSSTSYEP
jgi:hypothetical protein